MRDWSVATCKSAAIVCAALALSATTAAIADESDWRSYAKEANGDAYFYDETRVEKSGAAHNVWTRIRYMRSVMGASSYQSLVTIDCAETTERTLERTFFSDRDWTKPAMNPDTKTKPKRPIAKGSPSARLAEILCQD